MFIHVPVVGGGEEVEVHFVGFEDIHIREDEGVHLVVGEGAYQVVFRRADSDVCDVGHVSFDDELAGKPINIDSGTWGIWET